jgi:hypothetical protein
MSPVWRMVIVPGTDSTLNPDPEPTGTGATFTFPSTSNVNRSIYFNDPAATGLTLPPATADGVRFFTTEAINPILPQQYAVVGPGENSTDTTYRDITVVGRTTMSDPLRDIDPTYLDVTPRIDMTAIGTPVVNNPGGSEPTASTIQGVVPVVIRNPARLSVSEPDPNSGADAYPAYTTVGTPNKLSGQNYYGSPLYDVPFDNTVRGRIPAVASALLENGIRTSVAVVHLQRLADPTRTFNAQTNPYRTIDSMPIDLTVFNGWSATAETSGGASLPGTMMFATHERGEQNTSAEGANNIWITHPNVAKTVSADTAYSPSGSNPPLFRYTLKHTLGFLNAKFNATSTTPTARRTGAGDPNKGDPDTTETPLPWLTWNNRPFVSPVELLLVPSATSARLLNPDLELPTPLPPPPRRPNDYYGVGSGSSPYTTESGPFSHLMNFFSYSNGTGSSTTDAARLYQILDFLGVPSPFVGTEFQANATSLADTSDPTFQHALYPPFHLSASYREPGRINLNTVASPDVWDGLMNYYPGLAYTPFALSRQGFTGGNWWDPSTSYPTRFANPFRSSAATMLNPLPPPGLTTEINGTMLRPTSVGASAPLFSFTSTNAYDNTTRSPFHRYHPLTRTSNLVTTRSNAYAVWITVGYFTVTSGAVNLAHPDGYYLGEEVGAATGKITRHRAFYIIDRSIPAGFVRGEDLNVGNTFRLMRFIE